jgi:putative transcription antitermination factor YqgF
MNSPMLGLDIGLHRTGVALSENGLIATPLATLTWQLPHSHALISQIIDLVRQYSINTIVVGLPYGEHDEETLQASKTTAIVQQLESALRKASLTAEIVTLNEFYTTQDASLYFPDADLDAAAAALILQDYLEQLGESR